MVSCFGGLIFGNFSAANASEDLPSGAGALRFRSVLMANYFMREKHLPLVALVGGLLIATAFVVWLWSKVRHDGDGGPDAAVSVDTTERPLMAAAATVDGTAAEAQRGLARSKLKSLLQSRLETKNARAHEAVLTFKSEDAYRKFLARAGAVGLRLRGQIDSLRTVRVGYDTIDPLVDDMLGNATDFQSVDANYLVQVPATPAAEDRPKVSQVPLGNNSLAFLGVTGDHSQWGRGVTVAVLDSGVAADVTLSGGRVQYLDLGFGLLPGTGPEDGHGTAVAGLVAGASPDAPGVASAAAILSIRVTGADGSSDSFTLAQGILAAVDAGARIINISMGSYSDTAVLASAIGYASAQGAVIVASAGNDGAAQLTWPAADSRVVSVGAVDALEQQVYFSNGGAQLKITAPGYGVDTAWLNGQRVSFDGTSASAPLVAGAIAAVMSTTPGLSATEAWAIVQRYASDGGAPGPDPEYGGGILNLGWAMNRNDPTRVDTAIAGEYYDSATGTMNVVVQNRGAQAASGLQLNVTVSGVTTSQVVPALNSGATYLFKSPVSAEQLAASGGIVFRTQLINSAGTVDQVPANNAKSGVIIPPVK